jgi:hypothetical protein
MIKQGADTTLAVTHRALASETFLKLSLVVDNADLALEPNVVKMLFSE